MLLSDLIFNINIIDEQISNKLQSKVSRSQGAHRPHLRSAYHSKCVYLFQRRSVFSQFIKDGFNTSAVKFAPIWLSGFSILALTVAALWVFKDQDPCVIESQKRNMPGYRYMLLDIDTFC